MLLSLLPQRSLSWSPAKRQSSISSKKGCSLSVATVLGEQVGLEQVQDDEGLQYWWSAPGRTRR